MTDNYGFILFGWQIEEDTLEADLCNNPLNDGDDKIEDFDDFLDRYSYWTEEPSLPVIRYVPDPMMGERGFFGVLIHMEDLEEDQEDAYIIPDEEEYMEMFIRFSHEHPELYKRLQACTPSERKQPRFMFAVQKF